MHSAGADNSLVQELCTLWRALDPEHDPILWENENSLPVVMLRNRRMASVEDHESGALLLSEQPWSRFFELFIYPFCMLRRGRFGGLEKIINCGGKRTLDFCDLPFPVSVTG